MTKIIDLRSDTVTVPSLGMREAMFKAKIGDDVFSEDSTVNLLQQRVANLLNKESALFVEELRKNGVFYGVLWEHRPSLCSNAH